MKNTRLSPLALPLLAGLPFVGGAPRAQAQQANKKTSSHAENKPESLGFSSERLGRLHAAMQREVDEKQLAGVVTILARHGKMVEDRTYGKKDIATGAPMTKDTIFRDLLDDQAGHRRGHDDSLRRRQVASLRSDLEIHSRVCPSEGVQGRGCRAAR